MKTVGPNTIALVILIMSTGLMIFLFAASRNDPRPSIAALVAGPKAAASLGSSASTNLTGKDVTKKPDPSDLPPHTTPLDTSTVKVGPVPPVDPATPPK